MCKECRQTPCHPRCPNADEPRVAYNCEICDGEIYEGDDMYKIFDAVVCEDCVHDSKKCAEVQDV